MRSARRFVPSLVEERQDLCAFEHTAGATPEAGEQARWVRSFVVMDEMVVTLQIV